METPRQRGGLSAVIFAIACVSFGILPKALAQQDKGFYNSTSSATVNDVLDLQSTSGTLLNFRTCEGGEILSQTGGGGDSFSVAVRPSGLVQASWEAGGVSGSASVGPNYAANAGWSLLKLQYMLGSVVLSVDSNSTVLASATENAQLLSIDLSLGSGVILGSGFIGCIEQVFGLPAPTSSSDVDWGVCPLESQFGCQPSVPNPCYTHPCKNQGVCSSSAQTPSGYTCRCPARYEGVHCQNDTGPLCNNPEYQLDCQNGGICQEDDLGNSTYCQCTHDFEGSLCELNRTVTCDTQTCANNGTCRETANGIECSCPPGFSGDNCAIDIDECAVHQCLNGGLCVDGIGGYTCDCTGTGYTGDRCSETVNECASQLCQNGGMCLDTAGGFVCVCQDGWTGNDCSVDVDECSSDPCQNDGLCLNEDNSYSCQCLQGYEGTNCEVNIDDCILVTCPTTFICVDGVDTFTCECPLGMVNETGSCVDYDECSSSPCVNGQCINGNDMYRCECPPGYNGTNCELEIDECASNPCQMNSTCQDAIDGFNCVCQPGFTDVLCNVNINDCFADPCQNGATCVDGIDSFTCDCMPGYEGDLCQVETDECAAAPCQNGATCVDQINDYACVCLPGYIGVNCSVDIDECESAPCQNGSTCLDEVDGYRCECLAEYAGDQCERYYDACVDLVPCQNGATCSTPPLPSPDYTCACVPGFEGDNCQVNIDDCLGVTCNVTAGQVCFDEVDGYRCACPIGYEDPLCSVEIDECASMPCINGGNCTDNLGNFTCSCPPGFLGDTCEVDVDECTSTPCQNEAICQEIDGGGYQCYCVPGFTGTNCQDQVNECLKLPCLNGATCEDLVNKFNCICAPGYTGTTCGTEIDECASNPCLNNATCQDGIAEFNCSCTPGFEGTLCEVDIDECASNPCNLGSCIDQVNGFACNCTNSGFNGSLCQFNIDDCRPDSCQNGAPCVDGINAFTCDCWPGYLGDDCSVDDDECQSGPCLNGAVCLQRSDQSLYEGDDPVFPGEFSYANASGFLCECLPGFEGDRCQVNIDECASSPCANSGTCNDVVNGYLCACAAGWTGVHCDIEVNECLSLPCQNGAVCTDLINDYSCACPDDYGGKDCDVLLIGCNNNACQNGATCVPSYNQTSDTHSYTCICDAGFTGSLCEVVTSASFEGSQFLLDTSTAGSTTLDYSLSLQTTLPDSILLFSGPTNGTANYFLLEMYNGDLYLKYSPDGTDIAALEIDDFGQQLNDGDYHTLTVTITNDTITMSATVAASSRRRRTATCSGELCSQEIQIPDQVTVQFEEMYIGGVSGGLAPGMARTSLSYTGCMQDIQNGGDYILPAGSGRRRREAVTQPGCTRVVQCPMGNARCSDQGICTDLWLTYSCDCDIGYAGVNCSESFVPATFRNEDILESYAMFNANETLNVSYSEISLAFRTRETDGLLFFTQASDPQDYLTAEVEGGAVVVSVSRSGMTAVVLSVGSGLTDGEYHSLSIHADQSVLSLTLDPRSDSELYTQTGLGSGSPDFAQFSLGGVADFGSVLPNEAIRTDAYFKGCLWDIQYNGYALQFSPLDLPVPSFPLSAETSLLLDGCISDDACADDPCENGGTCTVTWNDFECTCPTGFGGKNCSELTICSENPCPDGAACKDRPDGHDCVVEATFDGLMSQVTYRANLSMTTALDSLTLRVRTRNANGILYHSSNSLTGQFVTLYLNQSVPLLRFDLGQSSEMASQVTMDDGMWHDVEVGFSSSGIELTVDGSIERYTGISLAPLASTVTEPGSGDVTVGGAVIANNDFFLNYNNFDGCLDDVRLGGFLLPFYPREVINSSSLEQFEASPVDLAYGCPGNPDICNSIVCENSGTCVDIWEEWECQCAEGFSADRCQVNVNECELLDPCISGSTCQDGVNNYTCSCPPGYEGRHCEIEIDECQSGPCLQGSDCYDGVGFFNCTCLDGYTGTLCGVLINETCGGNPCKNGGACSDKPAGSEVLFECTCLTGYQGYDCGQEIDYCLSQPCQNGATCDSQTDMGTFGCTCPPGFSGNTCQTDVDNCVGVTCNNGGTCQDQVDGFVCLCAPGFEGTFCGTDINDCDPNPCQFGATCQDFINGYICTCLSGFEGVNCSVDINECMTANATAPCQNGGTCLNTLGGYICECPAVVHGDHCQYSSCIPASTPSLSPSLTPGLDPVPALSSASSPALGPGLAPTPLSLPVGVSGCHCPLADQALDCSLARCSEELCPINGSCQLVDGHWTCLCSHNVTGPQCQYRGPCTANLDPCVNGGTCQQTYQGGGGFVYTCQCPVGFNGTNCELEINWCDSNPCQQAGSNCTSSQETFQCSCAPGYEGTFCEIKLPDCASNLCQNNATCQDLDYGYRCLCPDGFSGDDCEVNVDECLVEPCKNGGTCTDDINAFICDCSGTGYQGSTCTEDVDECLSSPCSNNATCQNVPGTWQCLCTKGWLGILCNISNPCVWETPCKNEGECDYTFSDDGQSVVYVCRCREDYVGVNCDRFTGTVTNWALIGGVTAGAVLLLIVVIVLGVVLINIKNKRATKGTYSPSRQEISGSRVEMDNILKLPPEERLI